MPRNKDFKRRARARMKKTGESYTTARSRLLQQRRRQRELRARTPGSASTSPASKPFALLAGMSDATVEDRTGRDWKSWVRALDDLGAREMPHREIAALLRDRFEIGAWWSQAVTVGYERIRGLRAIGQQRGGDYAVSKTKTFRVPVTVLYRAFADARQRKRWLDGAAPTVRSARRNRLIRLGWNDGTVVEVAFFEKGQGRSRVDVEHGKLTDAGARGRMKVFWGERLNQLAGLLQHGNGGS